MEAKEIISKLSFYWIKVKKWIHTMYKKYEKLFPFIFFIAIIFITYYLFVYNKLLKYDAKIAGIISTLGIGFAIFQFWIGEINTDKRRLYDLRFNAINEINKNCILLISLIDKYRATKVVNKDEVYYEMNSKINTLNICLANNLLFLFPEVIEKEEYKNFLKLTTEFSYITTHFRNTSIEDSNNEKILDDNQMKIAWNNGMYDNLLKFAKADSDLYKLLRNYL